MNEKEFFEKYKFNMHIRKPHPVYEDEMKFDGLEAEYVSRLERDAEHYQSLIRNQKQEIDRLSMLAVYRLEDELKKKKA